MKKQLLSIILASCLLLTLTGCGSTALASAVPLSDEISAQQENSADVLAGDIASEIPVVEEEPEEPPFEEYDITLMAVGDNLIHMGVVNSGKQADGTLNYEFMFDGISDFLDAADIKVINQETIMGGNELGFSGYPLFNSPTEIGDAVANVGFNVVLHASNHTADKGFSGLENCVRFWETHPEVTMIGMHAGDSTEREIPLLEIKDYTFAVLNYTYGPNSSVLPSAFRGHLDMLCAYNENSGNIDFTTLNPQVIADIEAARELADIVVVFPHWGTEYTFNPTVYQRTFAKQMTEAGADLIIGTHPHVIEPVELVVGDNGRLSLCYYSLGNFVSTQKGATSMLEAMAWITFHVTEEGIVLDNERTGAIPLVCHYTDNVRIENVYLLENYTEEQASSHGIRTYGGVNLHLADLQRWSEEVLGDRLLTAGQAFGTEPHPIGDALSGNDISGNSISGNNLFR